MEPHKDEQQLIHELLIENQNLLAENNQLLKKIRRTAVWSFWIRIAWFFLILGIPFVLYYYVIEPYFDSFGSSFQEFEQGLREIPGWKQYYDAKDE